MISLVLLGFAVGSVVGQEAFVFAVMADVQYADKPSSGDRHYRTSLDKLAEAVEHLNKEKPAFVIQLGDIIDGRGTPGSQEDLNTVLEVFNRLQMPTYHVIGNHCLSVDREALQKSLGLERGYYDFTVPSAKGWCFVVTDGMDAGYGVMSTEQTDWFRSILETAALADERVICFNHFALLPEAAPSHRMATPQPILDALDEAGNVVAWFAGHDHQGGYAYRKDVHHVTIRGMVEAPIENAYALIELHPNIIRKIGFGKEPSRDMSIPHIIPIVDFNGDGIVDIKDLVKLIEHWGWDEPSFDIAPLLRGDGIVDVQDLEVFMRYWQQEVEDPTLIAHWKLDEADGNIAYDDSINYHDGTLYGNPTWRPADGKVNGALQFDGIDDYVSTEFVLNPADGVFSVFAWIKGGGPGQDVLSQTGGADWLLADPSEGKLMTELQGTSRGSAALMSNFVITDGQWHRIGFVWDGSYRTLYVDDTKVAKDTLTQGQLIGADSGLYIGAGENLKAGSFFSGLIDDVRIYNRAVTP